MNLDPITFYVPGTPVSQLKAGVRAWTDKQGRPRAQHFDKPLPREWKAYAKTLAAAAMGDRPPFLGPVKIRILLRFSPPRSWGRWKREAALAGRIAHTAKPDTDNCTKAIKDSITGIVWIDDRQCTGEVVDKEYHEKPVTWIKIIPQAAAPADISSRTELKEHHGFQTEGRAEVLIVQ